MYRPYTQPVRRVYDPFYDDPTPERVAKVDASNDKMIKLHNIQIKYLSYFILLGTIITGILVLVYYFVSKTVNIRDAMIGVGTTTLIVLLLGAIYNYVDYKLAHELYRNKKNNWGYNQTERATSEMYRKIRNDHYATGPIERTDYFLLPESLLVELDKLDIYLGDEEK